MFKRRTSQPSKMDMIYEIYPIDTLCECSRFEVLRVAFVYCSLFFPGFSLHPGDMQWTSEDSWEVSAKTQWYDIIAIP